MPSWGCSTGCRPRVERSQTARNRLRPASCRISRARVVDTGRLITAGGITSGMEMGFHLLRRAGYPDSLPAEVARVMEYSRAYELYRNDIEVASRATAVVGS